MQATRTRDWQRRHFLQAMAAAAAAPAILPGRLFGAEAPSKTLAMACIGIGRMGGADLRELMRAGGAGVRVIAVCDVDRKRADKAAADVTARYGAGHKVDVYQDYRELLAREDLDGVVVAVPDHHHAGVAVAAVRAGKDVYLEKPLTYTHAEGRRLVEEVRKHKRILQTGTQQRSSQYFRISCELVRNGRIGKLQSIEVTIPQDSGRGNPGDVPPPPNLNYPLWLGPTPDAPYCEDRVHPQNSCARPGWLQIRQYSHGMITGWGAHMFDIANWGLGPDAEQGLLQVAATAEFPDRGLFDVHTTFSGDATFANGVRMTSHPGPHGTRFNGEKGWIRVDRGGFTAHDREIFREKIAENEVHLYQSKDHMGDFLNAMRTRKDPACPVEVGHRANTLCLVHSIAMRLGRKLTWDLQQERFKDDDEANAQLDYPHRKGWEV